MIEVSCLKEGGFKRLKLINFIQLALINAINQEIFSSPRRFNPPYICNESEKPQIMEEQ